MFQKILSIFYGTLLLIGSAFGADKDIDFNVRLKPDNSGVQINWSSKTLYGTGNSRIEGSGKVVERERSIIGYSKIRILGPIDVKLRASESERIKVSADDNVEPLIETRLDGETLVVDVKKDSSFSTRNKVVVHIDFKRLDALVLAGSGDIHLDRISGEKFTASISGSGDIKIADINVAQFMGSVSGSGELRVAGKATTQIWSIAGSGDVWSEKLKGQLIKISIAGSGDARLGSAETLDVTIAGSGDVTYSGTPSIKKVIVGSGSVTAR